jgi:hypothetical protein
VVDDAARPAVADQELQLGELLKHLPRKPGPLLGDDDDLVIGQLRDQPLRRDRLAIDGDLGVVRQLGPVAVLQGNANVVIEYRDLRHASTT